MKPRYLIAQFLLIFAFLVLYLQSHKAPWVDECYSYYGVWHDNFTEFYDSMLTGINFSPPLYFMFNFLIQLIFPTSIEQLRIQSLIFIITGIMLSFLLTRNIFGTFAAFFATSLVISQSNLLLSQAQEARHYAMFFACGAWVLHSQSLRDTSLKKHTLSIFLSNFCLCQVHYLGIIFSFLNGVAYFLTSKNKELWKKIPKAIIICWLLSIVSYLFYLTRQKSILNTWPKPNEISDLLDSYNDSILILSIIIPLFVILIINKTERGTKTQSIEEIQCSKPIIITSLLWFSVPFTFWALSHLSSINLFVDRYFIPKEVALIVIVSSSLKRLYEKSNIQCTNFSYFSTIFVCIFLVGIQVKRFLFILNPTHNYHHKLIIMNDDQDIRKPIIYTDDPSYFSNAYFEKYNVYLLIQNSEKFKLYKDFSKRINVIKQFHQK